MFHGGRTPIRVHAQVERQRRYLEETVSLEVPVEGAIVFVENGLVIKGRPAEGTTPVIMESGLESLLLGPQASRRPIVLEGWQVAGLAASVRHGALLRLSPAVEPPAEPPPMCSRCGAEMVERVSKRGRFLGCSTFPRCRMTVDLA